MIVAEWEYDGARYRVTDGEHEGRGLVAEIFWDDDWWELTEDDQIFFSLR